MSRTSCLLTETWNVLLFNDKLTFIIKDIRLYHSAGIAVTKNAAYCPLFAPLTLHLLSEEPQESHN